MTTSPTPPARTARRGAETRRRAQEVALELFTRQGYESTSLREIADELGINKASLYYYFASKEAILRSLVEERGTEAEELLAWVRAQPAGTDVLEQAALRWVGTFTADKLRAIRFMSANPLVLAGLSDSGGERIGSSLDAVAQELAAALPVDGAEERLLLRMAILSINSAVQAAASGGADDDVVIRAAHRAARALLLEIRTGR